MPAILASVRGERVFDLDVEFRPPVKQTAADGRERQRQAEANDALGAALSVSYPAGLWSWSPWVDLSLEIRYERGLAGSDSANIIGGVADQLERHHLYASDAQLRRISYSEQPSRDGIDRYHLRLSPYGMLVPCPPPPWTESPGAG